MLETLGDLHYSYLYEHDEAGSEVCQESSKKLVALSLAVCTLVTTQPAEAAPVLQYGDSGAAVVQLQNQLKQAGCFPISSRSTGYYNEETYAAVEELQRQNGLLVDGIVGEQTNAALAAKKTCVNSASNATLKLGDRGEDVRLLQIQLANWGFPLAPKLKLLDPQGKPTGIFDSKTQKALQEFEAYFELKQDGIFDAQDYQWLWASKPEAFARLSVVNDHPETRGGRGAVALGKMGPRAVPDLVALLKSNNKDDRFIAASGLTQIRSAAKPAVPALIRLLKSDDKDDRFMAAGTLADIPEHAKAAVPALIRLLKSDDTNDRWIAAYALARIQATPKDAVPVLIPLLKDQRSASIAGREDLSIAIFVAAALPTGADAKAAIPALVDLLTQGDKDSGRQANNTVAEVLNRIISEKPTDLLQALVSSDHRVRRGAAFVIGYRGTPDGAAVDPRITNRLQELVKNPNENLQLRKTAAISLTLLKQDMEPFYTENKLTSISKEWKKCPRQKVEVKQIEVYFDPLTLKCEVKNDIGDGFGAWFSFWRGRGW